MLQDFREDLRKAGQFSSYKDLQRFTKTVTSAKRNISTVMKTATFKVEAFVKIALIIFFALCLPCRILSNEAVTRHKHVPKKAAYRSAVHHKTRTPMHTS